MSIKNKVKLNKIITISMLTTLSFMMSYLESYIHFFDFGFPIKIGFANIITLYCIYNIDIKSSFTVSVIRIIFLSILFSNLILFFISFMGFIFSFFIMIFLYKFLKIDIIIISICGGIFHNLGQLTAIIITFNNLNIIKILPILNV